MFYLNFGKLEQDLRTRGELKWKHVMHLVRLLLSGITILRDGVVPVNVGDFRERLMPIRLGKVSWEDVNVWRLELHKEFDLAFENTKLPDRPDYEQGKQISHESAKGDGWTMKFPEPLYQAANNHSASPFIATVSGAHLYGFPSPDSTSICAVVTFFHQRIDWS